MPLKIINNPHIRRLSYKKLLSWYAGLTKPKTCAPPYSHIVQIGDPILRSASVPVPEELITSPEIGTLIAHMKQVFNKYNCLGLSAPQLGLDYRLIMFELDKQLKNFTPEEQKARNMIRTPFMVVINPEMKVNDYSKVTSVEGCQSIKGFNAEVPRYSSVQLNGFSPEGKEIQIEASGWIARIIQHEMDHLNGILYTDKMVKNSLSCACWQLINERGGKVELPYYY